MRLALALCVILALPVPARAEWHVAQRAGNAAVIYTAANASTAGRPIFAVECSHGRMSVTVHWQQLMTNSHVQPVVYSVDGEKKQTRQWRISTDTKSLGLWGHEAAPFARRLFAKSRFSVWAVNRRGKLLAAHFQIDGLERAILSLARACPRVSTAAR